MVVFRLARAERSPSRAARPLCAAPQVGQIVLLSTLFFVLSDGLASRATQRHICNVRQKKNPVISAPRGRARVAAGRSGTPPRRRGDEGNLERGRGDEEGARGDGWSRVLLPARFPRAAAASGWCSDMSWGVFYTCRVRVGPLMRRVEGRMAGSNLRKFAPRRLLTGLWGRRKRGEVAIRCANDLLCHQLLRRLTAHSAVRAPLRRHDSPPRVPKSTYPHAYDATAHSFFTSSGAPRLPRNERKMLYMICMPLM